MAKIVIGVDSSTQSTKVEARDVETGAIVGTGASPHPPTTPPVSEQDPLAWWSALAAAVAQLGDVRHDVVAISVAGQQHGLVLLDEGGLPVRPAKLWNDTTSAAAADELVAAIGADAWAERVGSAPVAAFTIAKLAWVAQHENHLLNRVRHVLLPHDYLSYRLTGRDVTDRGDASGTGWFDPTSNTYCPDLLDLAGVDGTRWLEYLPQVLGPTDIAGSLLPGVAADLGLPPDVIVGPGSGDNMGAALGLGLATGDLVISLGTSGVAYAMSSTATHDPSGSVAGFADAAGGFLPLVCTLNATKVTDTVARWLGTDAPGLAALAMNSDPVDGATPIVVPWFDGERTPNRPDAAGSLIGLRTDTSPEQIAQAAHDGVLCGLFNGVDALRQCGVTVDGTLHLIGGGARSAAYRQRCADLWQQPIAVPITDETVATGAAVQAAAIAAGEPLSAVQQRWELGASNTIEPRARVAAGEIRRRYAEAIAPL